MCVCGGEWGGRDGMCMLLRKKMEENSELTACTAFLKWSFSCEPQNLDNEGTIFSSILGMEHDEYLLDE